MNRNPTNWLFFWAGDHGADDGDKVERLELGVNEDLYALKNFCWNEVRMFTHLKEIVLMVSEDEDDKDTLMRVYETTAKRTRLGWPNWVVPMIKVKNTEEGTVWGQIRIQESADKNLVAESAEGQEE
ncbi:hypothetical protein G7Y89_g10492 [Cudoniella acicularis]|uniref:Uncharacterized protein n=1 Tax=Cudoniella acicularis TaxID=354080 RepID=A0A8H4RCN4_9HELO|nr:hypothetical protein G7Y89_g10492 [Cudoniella acicularis]